MITRTSQPASGAMLISEMKEFASFPKATQRYIRRSLDVAYGRRDPIEGWARDEGEAASIRAQARLYKQLDHLRLQVPDDSGLDMRRESVQLRRPKQKHAISLASVPWRWFYLKRPYQQNARRFQTLSLRLQVKNPILGRPGNRLCR